VPCVLTIDLLNGIAEEDLGSNLELCSCAKPSREYAFDPVPLTPFRRCGGNRAIHARQYDLSNQILVTWIGHFDAREELSQVVA
jgi:hypothetical protein